MFKKVFPGLSLNSPHDVFEGNSRLCLMYLTVRPATKLFCSCFIADGDNCGQKVLLLTPLVIGM